MGRLSRIFNMIFPFSFWGGSGISVVAPILGPTPGVYSFHPAPLSVNISTPTVGAYLRYTTNGTTPSASVGTLVTSNSVNISISRNSAVTVMAVAFMPGGTPISIVTVGDYEVWDGSPP